MKILFVHANFPGQYRYLAVRLAQDPTNTVVAIMDERNDVAGREQFGIQVHKYKLAKVVAKAIHPYVAEFDDGVRRGQQVARICVGLRQKGFIPEVICVHPGWGSALYLKDVYPESRVLTYCESYNPAKKPDFDFDPEYPGSLDTLLHGRTWNAINLLSLDSCDWGLSPRPDGNGECIPPHIRRRSASFLTDSILTESSPIRRHGWSWQAEHSP